MTSSPKLSKVGAIVNTLHTSIELGYGSDLYMNSEDETEVNKKSALEKGTILEERELKRRELLEKYELLKRMRQQEKQPSKSHIAKTVEINSGQVR